MGSGIGKRALNNSLSALDRIKALEHGLAGTSNGAQQAFVLVEQRLQSLEEILTALVNVFGPDTVRDQVVATRKAQTEANIQAAKTALATAVEKEYLLPLDKLPSLDVMTSSDENADAVLAKNLDNILIVGREFEKDGTVSQPGRVQQPLGRLLPTVRASLADQAAGAEVSLPEDRKFVLDELYIENPTPPVEPVAAEVAGDTQAAQ